MNELRILGNNSLVICIEQIFKREKNRRRSSWVGYCFGEKKPRKNKNKNKKREELGVVGFKRSYIQNIFS